MKHKQSIQELKKLVASLVEPENVTYLGVFGSFSRGEEKKSSDIDMVVAFKTTPSLFRMMDFEDKLQKLIGRKIDLLTHDSINPLLKSSIYQDLVTIYEKS